MPTDLASFIQQAKICNTHEHLSKQSWWEQDKPDVLRELFETYCSAELISAGATAEAVAESQNTDNPDLEARWRGVADAWPAVLHTGYGQATAYIARHYFGIEQLNLQAVLAAQAKLPARWPAADRRRILAEDAGYDHVQVDDFCWPCLPDKSGPEFFFYDISWADFSTGRINFKQLCDETGVDAKDLASLRQAMETIFRKYAACAIAVKTQQAYSRTLAWRDRTDTEAAAALDAARANPDNRSAEDKNALGDWCLARGVELATQYNLPVKVHTGYLAGWGNMQLDAVRPSQLCPLLAKYPKARFVLMHIGYPYGDEMMALAKHYPGVRADMVWSWTMNPRAAGEFLRRYIHSAPANKLFAFGGDTKRPRASAAYSWQARRWITRALQAEVDEGELTEPQAIDLARRILHDNQQAFFDVEAKRRNIRQQL